MKKKLQVFVSSTYTDLTEERQAAVQAILDAGHIPAGMELFKAGNASQLQTIYRWIDECDIYMLILGGRYGSIDLDSQKSYTQLEYEYAIKNNVPVFSVVLTNKMLHFKAAHQDEDKIFEKTNNKKYDEFKKLVMSKIVREVDSIDKISIAIHTTLIEFQQDSSLKLKGWIKNDSDANNNIVTTDTELLFENYNLLKQNSVLTITVDELKTKNIELEFKLQILQKQLDIIKKTVTN